MGISKGTKIATLREASYPTYRKYYYSKNAPISVWIKLI